MKLNLTSLLGRVSKRIFGLFILSALIPVFTIYLISYNQISKRLDNESKRQLYQESRALGLAAYDRLLSLETNLKIIAREIDRGSNYRIYENDEWLQNSFSNMFIIENTGLQNIIFGQTTLIPSLTADQKKHLSGKNSLLISKNDRNLPTQLFLLYPLQDSNNDNLYLVGQIDNSYLWNFPVYEPNFVCVITDEHDPLYCTPHVSNGNNTAIISDLIDATGTGFKYVELDGEQYAVRDWSLFLKARFFMEEFNIVVGSPKRQAFMTFYEFKSTFPQMLITTLVLIALISISQIKKIMTPLQKLTNAANRIKNGDYDTPVKIDSGDEFEELANTFNDMAKHINKQFKTMSVLADIDRLILSSFDTDHIVATLIRHMRNIIDADHVCVITMFNADETSSDFQYYLNTDRQFKSIDKQSIDIRKQDIEELSSINNHALYNLKHDNGFLTPLKEAGDNNYLFFSIFIKDKMAGAIGLGFTRNISENEVFIQPIRELADRVAVALSNAMWERQLYNQAHFDSLTELPNRFLFQDRLEREIQRAERNNRILSVLFIDLDHFKDINDTQGHVVGDEILIRVGKLFSTHIRTYDSLARWGGDEFIIFLSDFDSIEQATVKSEQLSLDIINVLGRPIYKKTTDLYITPSIGISIYPTDGTTYHDLLKCADSAMYKAKRSGRNTFRFHDNSDTANILEKIELVNNLHNALENNELRLYYQPKTSCKTGKVIGAEALLRWQHPQRGLLYPETFLSLAEQTGIIDEIGEWVLLHACKTQQELQHAIGKDFTIAINLSNHQFKQKNIIESVRNTINETGIDPEMLELEITESVAMEDYEHTRDLLTKFKELGINIAIDNFGTGQSSLTHLQMFPADKLKLNRTFISKLPHDKNTATITSAMITLAHNLNLSVTAEGVETQAQCEFLIDADCDEIQGHVIAQPLTDENYRLFLLREKAAG